MILPHVTRLRVVGRMVPMDAVERKGVRWTRAYTSGQAPHNPAPFERASAAAAWNQA